MECVEGNRILLIKQVKRLQEKFSGFELAKSGSGNSVVKGNLNFSVAYCGKVIKDDYDVEIEIPDDYPQSPPTVREVGSKIPKDREFHVNTHDGTLCLGAPLAVKRTFAEQRSLLWFVEKQVVPFLFGISYKMKYGQFPFGELSHGSKGLLEHYKELFAVKDDFVVLEFFRLLCVGSYDEHAMCPCGSGLKLRTCHRKILKKVRRQQRTEEFQQEYLGILIFLNNQLT